VRRTRLLRRLRSVPSLSVISLVAPPGYGKTSLLVQWATEDPRPVAWLTADEGDNDPVVFLTDLAMAIDRLEPLDREILGAIASPSVSTRAVVGRLLAAMVRHPEPVRIAIDDAHRILARPCLDALAELIGHLPEGSQVAIAGRARIRLPFARWRAQGSLLELGPADLAMDEHEVLGLSRELHVRLSAEATAELTRRTEGWPALLALAALGTATSTDASGPIGADSDRLVDDYLRTELLEGRPKAEIDFLTRTSILDRLSGPLCDAVTDRPGSADLLDRLARSTLLVDEYGGSYRYHTLLREFLQRELAAREPKRIATLHRRAAGWFRANGPIELAVDHAFAAGDLDLAAAMVGTGIPLLHWSGRRTTTRGWVKRFGDEALEERPWLAVLGAWEEMTVGDVASTTHLADLAERGTFEGRPPDGTASFESGRAMLRSAMCRAGAGDALANATRAVELERDGSFWRDFALWLLAIARLTIGDRDGGDAALADAAAAARSSGHLDVEYTMLGHRALLAVERGDWGAAAAYAEESAGLGVGANAEGFLSGGPARAGRIWLEIHRGDIAGARRDLAQATRFRPRMTAAAPAISVMLVLAFARAHLAVDDAVGARTLVAQADEVIRLRPDLGVLPAEVDALRATAASLAPPRGGSASSLTVAELRVLALLPYYLSFKEIGQRLGVKETTIKSHALAIYTKLGAATRADAVDLATDAGLLEPFELVGDSPRSRQGARGTT
jgi:LuxR family maltose regulon positive regulatory protein